MLERLVANLLQRLLSQYFDHDGDEAGIWSGFVRYQNLQLRVDEVNQKLARDGLPARVVHGSVRNLTITVPWGKLASSNSPVVIVLDGVLVLSRMTWEFDDEVLRQGTKAKRRKQLHEGIESLRDEKTTWADFVKCKLQEGFLPALAGRVEILVRDFHLRLEEPHASNPYALGVVLESLHLQNGAQKLSQFNHFAVYLNSIEKRAYADYELPEHSFMSFWPSEVILSLLDKMIPRRITEISDLSFRSPAHTYLLMPVDGSMQVVLATPAQQLQERSPIAKFVLKLKLLDFELRDMQCIQLLELYYDSNTHKYRRQHYRQHRPFASVRSNPRAWWKYACTVVRLELRKHRPSFRRRYQQRKRYCYLYERQLMGTYSADDAAGPSSAGSLTSKAANDEMQRSALQPLSLLEEQELRDLEDGIEGDLPVEDILLFRILVRKRIGYFQSLNDSADSPTSWFRRFLSHEDEADQDYQRIVKEWQEWTEKQVKANIIATNKGLSPVAVSVELIVDSGHVALFAPLPSTFDQLGLRRLQEKFLSVEYTALCMDFALMRDFTSITAHLSLLDCVASELRNDQKVYTVMTQFPDTAPEAEPSVGAPVVELSFTKNPPNANSFHFGFIVRVRSLHVILRRESEWIVRMRALIRPLPQFEKAAKFWKELSMANINTWVSRQLGLLVKANAIMAEHKNINLDVVVDCPILRLSDGQGKNLVMDLGRARCETHMLSGLARSAHSQTPELKQQANSSTIVEGSKPTDFNNAEVFLQDRTIRAPQGNGAGVMFPSSADSIDLGSSVHFDESVNYGMPATNVVPNDHDDDFYFYDVFELHFEPKGIAIEHFCGESHELLAPIDISVFVHKSVLPADHTLCRYKTRCSIPSVSLTLTEDSITFLHGLLAGWSKVMSGREYASSVSVNKIPLGLVLNPEPHAEQEGESGDDDSYFDENEFFDAVESEASAPDFPGGMLEETWAADTESAIGSETKSFLGKEARRRRRRQMSDVSSLSDASVVRRRGLSNVGGFYLSAENLARLEEEVPGESSVCEGDADPDEMSFHSALSLRQLNTVREELMADILSHEAYAKQLRGRISVLRHQGKEHLSDVAKESHRTIAGLRLELQRSEVKLKTLRAAHLELDALPSPLDVSTPIPLEDLQQRTLRSLNKAANLIQGRRRTRPAGSWSELEHALTIDLKRDSLRCTFSIGQINAQLELRKQQVTGLLGSPVFVLSACQVGLVLRRRSEGSRVYASVESLEGSFLEPHSDETRGRSFIVGGVNYELAGNALPSRFPHLVSPASMEEKFLKCAFELKKGPSFNGLYTKLMKLRIGVGDVEITPSPAALTCLRGALDFWKSLAANRRKGMLNSEQSSQVSIPVYRDVGVRLSALRLLFCDDDVVAAFALTDVGVRLAMTPQANSHARTQIYANYNNIQLLWILDYDAGHGMEALGKRDAHSPVVRLRMRYQDSAESDVVGWVSDCASVQADQSFEQQLVSNIHLGLKVDGLSAVVVPDMLSRFGSAIRRMKSSWSTASLQKVTTPSNNKPQLPRITRWRVDLTLRPSCIVLQANVDLQEDSRVGESIQRRLLIFFSAYAVLQPSNSSFNSWQIRQTIQDLSLSKDPDDRVIMEPITIRLTMGAPLSRQFPKSSSFPQLTVRDESMWVVSARILPKDRERADCGSQITSSTSISHASISLTPSELVLIADIGALLSQSTKSFMSGRRSADGRGTENKSMSGELFFVSEVDFDGIQVTLAHEPVSSSKSIDRVVAIEVDRIQVLVKRSNVTTNLTLSLGFGSITDLTIPSGVRSFTGGSVDGNGTSVKDPPGAEPGFISLSCQAEKVLDRFIWDIDLHVGRIHVLPLPSCVKAILLFTREADKLPRLARSSERSVEKEQNVHTHRSMSLARLSFVFQSDLIEVILSSKDIITYLRASSVQPIGVVSFRLMINANGCLRFTSLSEVGSDVKSLGTNFQSALEEFICKSKSGQQLGVLTMMSMRVTEFQVLRTRVMKSSWYPLTFIVTPPSIGEQRITNAFDFTVTHCAASMILPRTLDKAIPTDWRQIAGSAHSIHLQAGFVDVLLYIAQSSGGMNDALRVSVFPIADMLKDVRQAKADATLVTQRKTNAVFLTAPFVLSIRLEGLKLTCVPGGATLLTESPIAKVSLARLSGGFALAAVRREHKVFPTANAELESTMQNSSLKHAVSGGWIACGVSASYHNRRLVEWEPFVEPWALEGRFGVDLSKAFKLGPFDDYDGRNSIRGEGDLERRRSNSLDASGTRLRDIGRLLRSPFTTDDNSQKTKAFELSSLLSSTVDLSYLWLASASEALPLARLPHESADTTISFILPHAQPLNWLKQFGYPSEAESTSKNLLDQPSIICRVSDSCPLNINITGSLIENISGYVGSHTSKATMELAPHWIRNDSGLSVRFQEILDPERQARGEKAAKVTMACDTQVPLSLKRLPSQSCDPHKGFIAIELGSFEDTISRIDSKNLDARKGMRSSSFAYKIRKKIPVDTVGLRRYPIDWNSKKRDDPASFPDGSPLGWIIIRVALSGGIKMVTIESPLCLKNACDSDLLCEVRDHDGLSLLWRCLIPKARTEEDVFVSVPADIVPLLQSPSFRLLAVALAKNVNALHESDLAPCERKLFTRLHVPRPYSRTSLSKGVIEHRNVGLLQIEPSNLQSHDAAKADFVNISLCSVRIGSISLDPSSRSFGITSPDVDIPEQRMLVFRSTVSVANHLAYPLRVQVRVKEPQKTLPQMYDGASSGIRVRCDWLRPKWFDLGIIGCGGVINWTGAAASDEVEVRVRFEGADGALVREFLCWSSISTIPSDDFLHTFPHSSRAEFSRLTDLKLLDVAGAPLLLSVALSRGVTNADLGSSCTNVKAFAKEIPPAHRVIGIFVPFWIIDGTCLDLQYKSGLFHSGLFEAEKEDRKIEQVDQDSPSLGLRELLEDGNTTSHSAKQAFEVFMIGNEGSSRLQVRRRSSLGQRFNVEASPWSDPIPLSLRDDSYHDTSVSPPQLINGPASNKSLSAYNMEHFALRSRLLKAPRCYGGQYGTRLVHVVCRYEILNELGREIEIALQHPSLESTSTTVHPDCGPLPFHFDDTKPIRFRPREFGWAWSARFHVQAVRRSRRELTFCLRHTMKGSTMLVSVEVFSKQLSGKSLIILRTAPYAPYRLENRTVFAIQYRQISSLFEVDSMPRQPNNTQLPLLLPYHDIEFAWEEPESSRHSISLYVAAFDERFSDASRQYVGTTRIDRISPGSSFHFQSKKFSGQVVSDGPTRVLRIVETAKSDEFRQGREHLEHDRVDIQIEQKLTWMLTLKMLHGIGISLIDWTPQELVYVRLEDIFVEKVHGGASRQLTSVIGRVLFNNQLWVTPYPVLLRIGSRSQRRRHRRHSAISLSWSRRESSGTGYGNMTMFEFIELSVEPVTLCIDGNLTKFLVAMLRQAKFVGSKRKAVSFDTKSRNFVLDNVLGAFRPRLLSDKAFADSTDVVVDDLYFAVDSLATPSIAAKLRSHYRPSSHNALSPLKEVRQSEEREKSDVSRYQRKFYVERLRISTVAAEISWSGELPIASSLPRLLRPAFTFEGLPVLFRPLSSAHSFGTTEDHLERLRSHYISVWRILDLFVGVISKPTFLFRAAVFTWREFLGLAFESVASCLQSTELLMARLTSAVDAQHQIPIIWAFAAPVVKFNRALVHGLASFTVTGSRILRYNGANHSTNGFLARSRNPRLFANMDGKDLLVEYVEGENAGRAFLSRVAMGMHLGEGYNFHTEGIRLRHAQPSKEFEADPLHFILILTFERVLLVSGRLNENFCEVFWEAHFSDVVYLEVRECNEDPSIDFQRFVCFRWWFLRAGSHDTRDDHLLKALVSDGEGLAALRYRQMYVPKKSVPQLLFKLKRFHPKWIDELSI